MNLKDFKFPTPSFDTKADKDLLTEAKQRGFYNGKTEYNKLFSDLFFRGGSVVFKKDINEAFKKPAWSYCRALMQSWNPKHEEKEAICAMLMSELLELNTEKK